MNAPKRLIRFARANRSNLTVAEGLLWWQLRQRKLGVRFRCQDPVGPFIADFACRELKLVVEIDGITHGAYIEKDAARDRWMTKRSWTVLRFHDASVREDLSGTVEMIADAVEDLQAGRTPNWRSTGEVD